MFIMGKYTFKRGLSVMMLQIAFLVAHFLIATTQAIRCYQCPKQGPGIETTFPDFLKCTGDNMGVLEECEKGLKDPLCASVRVPKYNFTMMSCWDAAKFPSEAVCGVTKLYNATKAFGETDICACKTDGCIPSESQSRESHSNSIHKQWHFLIPALTAILVSRIEPKF